MDIKTVAIALYLLLIYWLSQSFPALKPLFYPTLGAFSYLFVSRIFAMKDLMRLVIGAGAASAIGSLFYMMHAGPWTFLVTCLCTIVVIRKFHFNAPPILAVSLIPFFSQPAQWWVLPLSVTASLSGLVVMLLLTEVTIYFVKNLWRKPAAAAEKMQTPAQ
ncbi:hypothetical protein PAESOLCIP111_06568 [Paenibacillus solanacearum]|uniref:HPP family protein n=1 Tax=Paenibacillus solanacearum TaxID=2048548 RepID=A0A916K8I6_9BACL|nr:hypothetical protein [Paenibacillus solanacearum]CAG7652558.1 hypothetical protein PAESOLCIP111_06568 [Paenibacillus solanacearum]